MKYSDAKKTLAVAFMSNFDSTIPVALDNRDYFIYTTGVPVEKPSDAPYVKFWTKAIKPLYQTLGTTGNRRFERQGMVFANVYVPVGVGTADGDSICEEILAIFESNRFNEIVCKPGYYEEWGVDLKERYVYTVTVPFTFDEVK